MDINKKYPIKTTEEIKEFFDARSQTGFKKYGVTMDRDDLTSEEWLTHMIEELADAIQYAWRLRHDLQKTNQATDEELIDLMAKTTHPFKQRLVDRMFRPITESRTYHDLNIGDDVFYLCEEQELTAAIIAGFVSDPEDGNLVVIQTGYDWVAVELHELFEEIK